MGGSSLSNTCGCSLQNWVPKNPGKRKVLDKTTIWHIYFQLSGLPHYDSKTRFRSVDCLHFPRMSALKGNNKIELSNVSFQLQQKQINLVQGGFETQSRTLVRILSQAAHRSSLSLTHTHTHSNKNTNRVLIEGEIPRGAQCQLWKEFKQVSHWEDNWQFSWPLRHIHWPHTCLVMVR